MPTWRSIIVALVLAVTVGIAGYAIGQTRRETKVLTVTRTVTVKAPPVIRHVLVVKRVYVPARLKPGTVVCHAITEDSIITDCDYSHGTWRSR